MASKNMTTIMALYLTFNLVLLGFTSAQLPVCSLNQGDIRVCLNILNLVNVTLNPQNVGPCCNILSGLEDPVLAVCACDIINASLLGGLIRLRLGQLVNLCPGVTLPVNLRCN
ncbi:hypothetical protein AALP_AA7G052100 [Arabis alpina]|uniref:Hydrophobic seed protein domain-containing protein n=1 Tax=Arabis alpina TaxID=50452 RepID=A0A087GG10_ARAAL|nr:hypothetical protein AALP_AA7G052100 [Arabis alpina]